MYIYMYTCIPVIPCKFSPFPPFSHPLVFILVARLFSTASHDVPLACTSALGPLTPSPSMPIQSLWGRDWEAWGVQDGRVNSRIILHCNFLIMFCPWCCTCTCKEFLNLPPLVLKARWLCLLLRLQVRMSRRWDGCPLGLGLVTEDKTIEFSYKCMCINKFYLQSPCIYVQITMIII